MTQNKAFKTSILSFFLTIIMVTALLFVKGYAPFGNKSFACLDANVDYLDFFCHLKNILDGKASFTYSFSKGLGGNMIGTLVTGYFSPLNLLLLFFKKSQIHSFFDIVVAIKMGLSSFTMALFIKKRFSAIQDIYALLCSLCYGLCQYNFAQASNIFFLDGTYTLPLFMLGTYYIVKRGKPHLLIFSVAYTVMFNWYMGGINCFFTVIWMFLEWSLLEKERMNIKDLLKTTANAALAGITGVMISGITFIPAIVALRKSSEGTLDIHLLKDINEFLGNAITIVTNYYWGSESAADRVSLFCGSVAMVCILMLFVSNRVSEKHKFCIGGVIVTVVLMYYWRPLHLMFSLFKYAGSFWSRYGFIGSFVMLFIAGMFLEGIREEHVDRKRFAPVFLALIATILVFHKDTDMRILKWVYATIICMSIVSFILIHLSRSKKEEHSRAVILSISLVIITLLEMWCNSWLLMNSYHQDNIDEYVRYQEQGDKQLSQIRENDNGYYRITQTKTREVQSNKLTALYDEAHAFNYWGIATYNSVPDDIQREFLDRSGYRINGEDMYIVNTSILPVDSLLGVKYILSDENVPGAKKDGKITTQFNGKEVYFNQYALPMAFTTSATEYNGKLNYDKIEPTNGLASSINPFLYQNDIYSQLCGKEVQLYIPLEYEKEIVSNQKAVYELSIPEGNYAVYGNLPWDGSYAYENVYADGDLITGYSRWLSPSVFTIPVRSNKVKLEVDSDTELSIKDEQFYALDLDVFKEVIAPIQQSEVPDYSVVDGHFQATVESNGAEKLITSIAYDPLWTVTVNGDVIEPSLFADTFMAVPLTKGTNTIEFVYKAGGVKTGLLLTVTGLVIVVILSVVGRRNGRKS